MGSRATWLLASLLALSAAMARAEQADPATVLVVANANNARSIALADYYMWKRAVPPQNKLLLNCDAADNADTCSLAFYNSNISAPIYAKIATLPRIDYIVLCRNLPVKITDTAGSVDSALAAKRTAKRDNPYYGGTSPFSSAATGVYLVTRLDGWSWGDAFGLVDRGQTHGGSGPFAFDMDPGKTASFSYKFYNNLMSTANSAVAALGLPTVFDNTSTFIRPNVPLGGYISWGSNDSHYSATAYTGLVFAPGAIVETLVSTSASNVRYPGGGQSQISTLVRGGVTGIKGYVAEPMVDATARPQILFVRYAQGANLAESFYAASPYMAWKDVVLGDPLCAPYAP